MNPVLRFSALAFGAFSILVLPLLHCRERDQASFDPRNPFLVAPVEGATGGTDTTDAVMRQGVPVAGRLVGAVPKDFDRWQWAGDETLTLITHSTSGRVDGVIFAEAVSDVSWPSLELDRFHRTVAPELASATMPFLAGRRRKLEQAVAAEIEGTTHDAVTLMDRLQSRTLNRGLGFKHRRHGFGGWRWLGTNPQGIRLRFGRAEGRWQRQASLDEVTLRQLRQLGEHSQDIADLQSLISRPWLVHERTSSVAASLVLGSASRRRSAGVHLAVLFEHDIDSAVIDDFAHFIDSLRPPSSGETTGLLASLNEEALERLSRRLGWQVLTEASLIQDEEFGDLVLALAEQSALE